MPRLLPFVAAIAVGAEFVGASSTGDDGSVSNADWIVDTTADPAQRAAQIVAKMTLADQLHMLHGSGSGYVGNVEALPAYGIPAIKMNDGPQGFRGDGGTSTAFPSGLTVGATWDVDMASAWGIAMGEEFYGKGANVQLGPGLCVARVPHNGRNFEYMSGEDPKLGAVLAPKAINGIQTQGVVANAKHWVNNNQETARGSISEVVDERTQFELYYPPFEAAVKEGNVGSVMCSYNRIRGTYSCENNETLGRDLKERLGFQGWVMSDWGATHSVSINQGLDQEMPGESFFGSALAKAVQQGQVSSATVANSVQRILTPLIAVGAFDRPSNGTTKDNVTSQAHNEVARKISSAATVLLNNDGVLPLDKASVKSIAIVGSEAAYPTTHGGGSGSVQPGYVATPLFGVLNALGLSYPFLQPNNCSEASWDIGFDYRNTDGQTSAPANSTAECCSLCANRADGGCNYFTFVDNTCWMKSSNANRVADASAVSGGCHKTPPQPPRKNNCSDGHFIQGLDYRNQDHQTQAPANSIEECCALCAARPDGRCNYFTLAYGQCFMKSTKNNPVVDKDATSGTCYASPPAPERHCEKGICVTVASGDDPDTAAAAAAQEDLTLVFVGTTSSEGSDRTSLSFGGGDDVVNAVVQATKANSSKKVVVIGVTPGAVLTPWAGDVAATLIPFMPGQEYGNAISDVLFGVVNPSARLPLTFPNVENEQNFSKLQWPGVDGHANYTEKAYFGYRYYDLHGIAPAFAFGHGLSYTKFSYSALAYDKATQTLSCTVKNVGGLAGSEVAQLYLGLPPGVRGLTSPAKQLKGFHKTSALAPGASTTVEFALTDRDLSVWDVDAAEWAKVSGTVKAYVGASSRDTRLTMDFSV